jgi:NADPH-dependent 7-cyano-7-deazaguanine reductase QueF
MSNKKQNSVDWLISCITEDQMVKAKSLNEWLEIFEQAKAVHKEEIVDAYCKAGLDIAHNDSIKESGLAQEYYIETYGGDDE